MKKLALATAGIFLLAPVVANAGQPLPPAQTAPGSEPAQEAQPTAPAKPDEPSTSKPAAETPKGAASPNATCSGKSTDAEPSHPSVKVGKDTGDLPPPRKKPSCTSQPDQ